MNNENQPGSSQPNAEAPTVRVCCTRPGLQGEAVYPHFTKISEADILDRTGQRQLVCQICGMPLMLGAGRRYVPIEQLGDGGFGMTFVAADLVAPGNISVLSRPRRVIKQLRPRQPLSPGLLQQVQEKFRGEVEVLSNLHHPNIPILYDFFEEEAADRRLSSLDDSGNNEAEAPKQRFFYFVQQYVDGIDLDKALSQQGAFSEPEVKTFLVSLLKILDDIHSGNHHSSNASIIHRDIKPANIICSAKEVVRADGTKGRVADLSKGKLYLIDFGTVKEVVQAVEQQIPSQASAVVSPGFSPPEQLACRPVRFFSDIYALGATCISLLTARNPASLNVPDDLSIWKKHASVSPGFAAVIDKMVAERSVNRYQSAKEVLEDLDRGSAPPPPPPPPPPWSKLLIIAASVLGLLALVVVGWRLMNRPPAEPSPEPDLISVGDKPIAESAISLSGEYEELKQQGIKAFADGDYATARDRFAEIRDQAKAEWRGQGNQANLNTPYGRALQDPTVLIYQNNAEVRLRYQKEEPIYRIAVPVPLNVDIGKEILFGIAQAQDRAVNPQNGAQPVNIEIVIANDLNNPEQAEAVAKSLIADTFDRQQILAVLGHYTSDNTCETLRNHYTPANIPVVSPLSSAASIPDECDEKGLFFRITSSTEVEASTLVNYLTGREAGPKVAIFSSQSDRYSRNLFNRFQSILSDSGGEVFNFDLSDSSVDVEARLNQVKDEVDALAVFPDGRARTSEPFQRAIAVIKASGGDKPIVGSAPLYTSEAAEQLAGLPNLTNNLILTTDWYQDCAPVFSEQVQSYWFGGVNRNAAHSYEAVQAVQATLTEGVTRDQIRQKLTEIQIPSGVFANKTISFDANGNREELRNRVLTTLGTDPKKPFDLVQGCPAD